MQSQVEPEDDFSPAIVAPIERYIVEFATYATALDDDLAKRRSGFGGDREQQQK